MRYLYYPLGWLALSLGLLAPLSQFVLAASTPDSVDRATPRKKLLWVSEPLPAEIDLSGYYLVEGAQDTKKYEGMASLVRFRSIYVVNWTMPGGNSFSGVGYLKDKLFVVSWAVLKGTTVIKGLNVYTVHGTTLKGRWTQLPGNGRIHTETLTLLKRRSGVTVDDE